MMVIEWMSQPPRQGFSLVNQLVAAGRAAVQTPEGQEMRAVFRDFIGLGLEMSPKKLRGRSITYKLQQLYNYQMYLISATGLYKGHVLFCPE